LAIERCRSLLPNYANNFHISDVNPKLLEKLPTGTFEVFMSNQVLYFLDNVGISDLVRQAFSLVKKDGVFIASMMAPSCWYAKFIVGCQGDFKIVQLDTPRQKGELLINFKERDELNELFRPFKKLHLGSYGSSIRSEEGSTDHWLFVGIKR